MSQTLHNGHKPTEPPELTIKQARLIELLVSGSKIVDAAKVLQVNESTCRRWLKLPEVDTAYKKAKDDLVNQVLTSLYKQGMGMLHKHIAAETEPTAASQIAAFRSVAEELRLNGELAEIKRKITDFEEAMSRLGEYR